MTVGSEPHQTVWGSPKRRHMNPNEAVNHPSPSSSSGRDGSQSRQSRQPKRLPQVQFEQPAQQEPPASTAELRCPKRKQWRLAWCSQKFWAAVSVLRFLCLGLSLQFPSSNENEEGSSLAQFQAPPVNSKAGIPKRGCVRSTVVSLRSCNACIQALTRVKLSRYKAT